MRASPSASTSAVRWLFGIAAVLFLLYVGNIVLGMLAAKTGAPVWRLNDVGEFLLVLCCMAFFVAGLMLDEGDTNATKGGA